MNIGNSCTCCHFACVQNAFCAFSNLEKSFSVELMAQLLFLLFQPFCQFNRHYDDDILCLGQNVGMSFSTWLWCKEKLISSLSKVERVLNHTLYASSVCTFWSSPAWCACPRGDLDLFISLCPQVNVKLWSWISPILQWNQPLGCRLIRHLLLSRILTCESSILCCCWLVSFFEQHLNCENFPLCWNSLGCSWFRHSKWSTVSKSNSILNMCMALTYAKAIWSTLDDSSFSLCVMAVLWSGVHVKILKILNLYLLIDSTHKDIYIKKRPLNSFYHSLAMFVFSYFTCFLVPQSVCFLIGYFPWHITIHTNLKSRLVSFWLFPHTFFFKSNKFNIYNL